MLRRAAARCGPRIALATAGAGVVAGASSLANCKSTPDGLTQLRSKNFPLVEHCHGKARVRVLRVRRYEDKDTVQEYTVDTRLFSPVYSQVFTDQNNEGLVATDTQKNTVYIIAQRSSATNPEAYAIDLAKHLLNEYPTLTAVEVDVKEDLWRRVETKGVLHEHGFVRDAPEKATAKVRLTRDAPNKPQVKSGITSLTVLKTTQSGFTGYLHDQYTLLPDTTERCLATEMHLEWTYTDGKAPPCYAAVRSAVRSTMLDSFFGPAQGGVYSASLQATIYDAGCLVLTAAPHVSSISISTPNIHMIPFHQLKDLTGKPFSDDVYVSTSDPAGSIFCKVARDSF